MDRISAPLAYPPRWLAAHDNHKGTERPAGKRRSGERVESLLGSPSKSHSQVRLMNGDRVRTVRWRMANKG